MTREISQIPDDHLLMWRMLSALDIPLAEAVAESEVGITHLSRMLQSCAHCRTPQLCALYLAASDGTVDTPPDFCPSRSTLERLHALHPQGHAPGLTATPPA